MTDTTPMYDYFRPSYQEIHNGCIELCDFFRFHSFEFTRVVGIAKGGLLPAKIIAENLSLPMSVVHYSSQEGQGNNKDRDVYFPLIKNTEVVLLVDDILDSGHTLQTVKQHYLNMGVAVYAYVLYHKVHQVPLIVPDFSWKKITPDSPWIIFPHERKEKLS